MLCCHRQQLAERSWVGRQRRERWDRRGSSCRTRKIHSAIHDGRDAQRVRFYVQSELTRKSENDPRLRCDEAPEEPVSVSSEQVLKIECNISITTNFMLTGIMNVRDFLPLTLPFKAHAYN